MRTRSSASTSVETCECSDNDQGTVEGIENTKVRATSSDGRKRVYQRSSNTKMRRNNQAYGGGGRGVQWWTNVNCKPTTTDRATTVCFCANVDCRRTRTAPNLFFFWLGGRPLSTVWRQTSAFVICYHAV